MSSPQNPWASPFPRLSIAHIEGKAHSVRLRQNQFQILHGLLIREKESLVEALKSDFGFSDSEALFEYSLALLELRYHYNALDLSKELSALRAVESNKHEASRTVGTGIVYIIPQRGLYSIISPLCAALSAGNCVVIELPQTTMRTAAALRNALSGALDRDIFAIATQRPEESFIGQCIVVAQSSTELPKASKLLIQSSTLKSFAFIDRSANLKLAARCITAARFGFNSSSSYAPEVVFVHEAVLGLLSTYLIPAANTIAGLSSLSNGHANSNERSKAASDRRVKEKLPFASLSEIEGTTLLFSGSKGAILQTDDGSLPAVLQSQLLTKSAIPLLLLCSVTSMDTAIDLAVEFDSHTNATPNSIQRPAAAFVFANSADAQYLSNSVDADLTCVNTFPAQLMVGPRLPKSRRTGFSSHPLPRYNKELFEDYRAVVTRESPASRILGDATVVIGAQDVQKEFSELTRAATLPLKPTGQGDGKRDHIFDVGLIISASMIGIPVLVGLGFLGKFAFSRLGAVYYKFR